MRTAPLTRDEQGQIQNYHDQYLATGLSTEPADRATAEAAFAAAYRRIGRDPVPVIWVDSPLGASVLLSARPWASLGASLWASLGASSVRPVFTSWWGSLDLFWVALYRFAEDVLAVRYTADAHKGLALMDAIGRSCGWWYPRDGVIVACERPERITMEPNPQRQGVVRLHADDGPAVRFRDGWSIYAWHGVRIPAKLIESPDAITREDLTRETNAEVRRAIMERLGHDRFVHLLDLVEVQTDPDGVGTLLRTRELDPVAGAPLQFVRVTDPSTGRVYHLSVPPTMETAREAVAWTFGHQAATYAPAIER